MNDERCGELSGAQQAAFRSLREHGMVQIGTFRQLVALDGCFAGHVFRKVSFASAWVPVEVFDDKVRAMRWLFTGCA